MLISDGEDLVRRDKLHPAFLRPLGGTPSMAQLDIPIDHLSFPAYRLADAGGARQAPCAFLSLAHWFEAEKFRPFARPLFDQAMIHPTIKEVRKFAKHHQSHWRGDWLAVRTRALACGMVYAAWSDPCTERWEGTAESIADRIRPLGLPERFLVGAAREYLRLRAAPRFAFLGAGHAPDEVVGKKINQVHKKSEFAWKLTHWQGRHGSWKIHDWALQQFVPIDYLGADDARTGPANLAAFPERCDTVVVFEKRRGRIMDAVVRGLRMHKTNFVDLELFTEAEGEQVLPSPG